MGMRVCTDVCHTQSMFIYLTLSQVIINWEQCVQLFTAPGSRAGKPMQVILGGRRAAWDRGS